MDLAMGRARVARRSHPVRGSIAYPLAVDVKPIYVCLKTNKQQHTLR